MQIYCLASIQRKGIFVECRGEGQSVNKQDFQVDCTMRLNVSLRLNQRSGEHWRNWERKIQGTIVSIGLNNIKFEMVHKKSCNIA